MITILSITRKCKSILDDGCELPMQEWQAAKNCVLYTPWYGPQLQCGDVVCPLSNHPEIQSVVRRVRVMLDVDIPHQIIETTIEWDRVEAGLLLNVYRSLRHRKWQTLEEITASNLSIITAG